MASILITGTSRRLGLHLTRHFLTQGHRVFAQTRNGSKALDQLQTTHPDQLQLIQSDPEAFSSVQAVVDKLNGQPLDTLIHNTSLFETDASDAAASWEQAQRLFKIHCILPKLLNEALQTNLQQSSDACIIHLSDIYSDNPNPAYANYCMSKAAVDNLVKSQAKALAPRIRVNAIQPGPILFLAEHDEAWRAQVMKETLLRKEGGLEALVKAIEALIHNNFMTGASLKVDGGRSLR